MNRIFRSICAGVLSAAMLLSLTGCRKQAAESKPPEPTPAAVSEEPERTESVTISAEVSKKTGADIAATARKLGLENVIQNEDGSCTIYLTEEERNTFLTSLRESIDTKLTPVPAEFQWPFLEGAEISEDCRSVTLRTTAARYNALRDNTSAQVFYLPCLLYIAFSGEDADSFVQHFTVVDTADGTVLCEFDYPAPEPTPSPEVSESSGETAQ